ncbi:hypothetical protein LINGRAHAP2_LOCUS30684 [Linum grandiflorum]
MHVSPSSAALFGRLRSNQSYTSFSGNSSIATASSSRWRPCEKRVATLEKPKLGGL